MKCLIDKPTLTHPNVLEHCSRFELQLDSICSAIATGVRPHDVTGKFAEVNSLMEALPLTSDEFNTAKSRLRNVVAYLHSGQRTISRYELGMLLDSVAHQN